MPDITSANAVFLLFLPTVFGAPQQLQGFSAEDIFETEPLEFAEHLMGVDGIMSGGFVFVPTRQRVMLQADSSSGFVFDAWWGASQLSRSAIFAGGTILFPNQGTKWALIQGLLTSYQPIPNAKKVLQPRQFGITWQQVTFAPT